MRQYRRQPTRLRHPWDSPGRNTGAGCHFLLQWIEVKSECEVAQSSLTLHDPMDCSLPGSSAHGIFQARVLEWGAIAFSIRIPLRVCQNADECSKFLIPSIWDEAWEFALLTSSQVRMMLLVWIPHLENHQFRQLLCFTVKEVGVEKLVDCPRWLDWPRKWKNSNWFQFFGV